MESMKRDEEGKPDAEHDQRNEEVTVGEDGSGLLGGFHLRSSDSRIIAMVNDGGEML